LSLPEAELRKEQVYDRTLFTRLAAYLRPYWKLVILALVLVLITAAIDLARPYILKVAIDTYLAPPEVTFAGYPAASAPGEGLEHNDLILVREKPAAPLPPELPRFQIVYAGGFYLVGGLPPGVTDIRVEETPQGPMGRSGAAVYPAEPLRAQDLLLLRQDDLNALWKLALIFMGIILMGFVLNYALAYLLGYTGQQVIYDLRQEIFSHLQKLSPSYFDRNPTGRLVTRLTNDVEALNEMYSEVLIYLLKDVFMLLGIMAVMLSLNWQLALISFTTVPLVLLSTAMYQRYGRPAYRRVRLKLAEVNSLLQEHISGIRVIKIFAREEQSSRQFDHHNRELLEANMRELFTFALYRPSMDLLYSLAVALLVWYGGGQVLQGYVAFGVVYAFINYIQQFFRPISDFSEKYTIMQSAMASSERLFALLDEEPEIIDPTEPLPLTRTRGEIEFQNVWFSYNPGEWVLKDINFKVEPGQTVAFVGHTGAGKSSLINLLNRFYDLQKGRILLDGADIRRYRQEDLRRQVGVVLQDVFLFSGDLASNIRLGREEISEEEVIQAARYVNADQFIRQLPGGYHYQVRERGATLSTGQRQLIAFARVLALNPPILVLDEATASIDTATEELIQEALKKLSRDRTTLIIAHRLSTIKHADRIMVLHRGEIRESGTHEELLAQKGIYYNLYLMQEQTTLPETVKRR